MSKKRKKSGNKKIIKTSTAKTSASRRQFGKWAMRASVFLLIAGTSAIGLSAYKNNWESERDLSVIGNGKPVVIQVHDSSCRLCRTLKTNVQDALAKLDGDLQYRIADIGTGEGRRLQRKYDVPHVTLLFFDGDGELKRTMNGVREVAELTEAFTSFATRNN